MDVNSFLMAGGTKSAAFPVLGTRVVGMIIEEPQLRDQTDPKDGTIKRWDNGDVKKQIVVKIQTELRDPMDPDDEGVRALYIKGQMQQAVRDAIRKAGGRGLEVGGIIAVTYSADGPPPQNKALKPAKLYTVEYVKPNVLEAPGVTPPAYQPPAPVQQTTYQQPQIPQQAPAPQQESLAAMQTSFLDRLRQQQPAPMFQQQSDEPPF